MSMGSDHEHDHDHEQDGETPDFYALALEVEDALFAADLKESELRVARLIVKLSLRWSRTTTPHMLQKDFGDGAGIRESHIAQTLGWLLGKKIILLEKTDVYRLNTDPQTWLVPNRVSAEWKARERVLMAEEYVEMWSLDAIRAGDPTVALRDAEVEVRAGASRTGDDLRNSEVGVVPKSGSRAAFSEESSEIRKSPIAIGKAESFPVTGTGDRSARAGFLEEQLGRLQRVIGETPYLPWWRLHAGKSSAHTDALRKTLDDYSDNREEVATPDRWMVKTFKNKVRAIGKALHLL